MVTATFRIVVYPERLDDVLRTVRPLISRMADQPGCMGLKIYQDIDNANAVTLVEEWSSEVDVKKHIASDDFRKILAVLDLSREPPEVKFETVSSTGGMEFIEAVRGK